MEDDVFAGVLDGQQPLDMSHEGGEFDALADLYCEMHKE
jgi:hypothetical protein